jgi:hypothetical protein
MRKSLTCKSPDKMKLILLVFAILVVINPSVRYTSGTALHAVADVIQGE